MAAMVRGRDGRLYPATPPGLRWLQHEAGVAAGAARRSRMMDLTDDEAARRTPRLSASDEAIALASELQDDDPDLSSKDALVEVFTSRPDLHRRYIRENAAAQTAAAVTQTSALDLTQQHAREFHELVAAKEHDGLSRVEAIGAAADENPQGYRAHVQVTTRTKRGPTIAALAAPPAAAKVAMTQCRARVFEELVAAKQAAGLSVADAYVAAQRENGDSYQAYRELALAGGVTPTIEKKKIVSSGGTTMPSALAIINAKAAEIVSVTGCSMTDAITKALQDSPSLYAQYTQELRMRAAAGVKPLQANAD